jgi:mRNA interferase RelE/StbE
VNVLFKSSFAKDLRKITDSDLKTRVKELIEQVEVAESLQNITSIKKLRGRGNYYRIRVAEYRIGLLVEGNIVTFVRCLDRKEIYRYFP